MVSNWTRCEYVYIYIYILYTYYILILYAANVWMTVHEAVIQVPTWTLPGMTGKDMQRKPLKASATFGSELLHKARWRVFFSCFLMSGYQDGLFE